MNLLNVNFAGKYFFQVEEEWKNCQFGPKLSKKAIRNFFFAILFRPQTF